MTTATWEAVTHPGSGRGDAAALKRPRLSPPCSAARVPLHVRLGRQTGGPRGRRLLLWVSPWLLRRPPWDLAGDQVGAEVVGELAIILEL